MNIVERFTQTFNWDISKHRSYCGYTNLENYINSLTMFQLFELISRAEEQMREEQNKET